MVGAYVAVLAKATDYWFKDKDDPEQKEGEAVGNGNDLTCHCCHNLLYL